MRVLLSAMGRSLGRDGAVAFLTLASGIWAAPNMEQAGALAGAASIAALVAVVRGFRAFIPQVSTGLAKALHVPLAFSEVAITAITTFLVGFAALAEGVLSAPDLDGARAAGLAGILAVGTALTRLVQAWLTKGELGDGGISLPPQPVPPEALPKPLPQDPGAATAVLKG